MMLADSLRCRVRAMNTLWDWAAAGMTLEQINHHQRPGVLPVAFYFVHVMRGQDDAVSHHFLHEAPLWTRGHWAARMGVTTKRYARGEVLALTETLRMEDLAAWKAYQAAVIAQTTLVLDGLTDILLAKVAIPAVLAAWLIRPVPQGFEPSTSMFRSSKVP